MRTRRLAVGVGAALMVLGGWAPGASAAVQGPGEIEVECTAKFGALELKRMQTFDPKLDVPATVFAGSTFEVRVPAGDTNLPSTQNPDGSGFKLLEFKDLSAGYQVAGGTLVTGSAVAAGVPTINGNPLPAGEVQHPQPDQWRTFTAGPVPPGTLHTPDITLDVVAGAAGTTITFRATGGSTTSVLGTQTNTPLGDAIVDCGFDVLVASVEVVAPPPPPPPVIKGAPRVANDIVQTAKDTPVTIDALANDEPDPNVAIDPSSFALVTQPPNGTATITDGKVVYTPSTGFVGVDELEYELCSEPVPVASTTTTTIEGEFLVGAVAEPTTTTTTPPVTETKCNRATIQVTVKDTPAVVQATTTVPPTTSIAATPTTGAPAPALPRTGGPATALPVVALGLLALGSTALRWTRRPRPQGG